MELARTVAEIVGYRAGGGKNLGIAGSGLFRTEIELKVVAGVCAAATAASEPGQLVLSGVNLLDSKPVEIGVTVFGGWTGAEREQFPALAPIHRAGGGR